MVGEAPEWLHDLNEAADIHPAIRAVRPLSAPSRWSIAGPRLGALFGLTVLILTGGEPLQRVC